MCTQVMEHKRAQIYLDTGSTTPAYRQIVDQLRALLVEGVLRPGETLPPVRRLALELGVHFNTVAEAYRTLAQEGFLSVAHGRGALVVERTPPAGEPEDEREAARTLRQRLRELVAELRARGVTTSQIAHELRAVLEGLES